MEPGVSIVPGLPPAHTLNFLLERNMAAREGVLAFAKECRKSGRRERDRVTRGSISSQGGPGSLLVRRCQTLSRALHPRSRSS